MSAADWSFREPPGHELFVVKKFVSVTKTAKDAYHVWIWDWHWCNTADEVQAIIALQKIIRPKRN